MVVVWYLTRYCELDCDYCCTGEKTRDKDLDLSLVEEFIDKKATPGELHVLTGGEPTMYQGWEKVVEKLYNKGCRVKLHTNAEHLHRTAKKKQMRETLEKIDIMNLPLDGGPSHDSLRGRGHRKKVLKTLKILDKTDPRMRFSFTTCVTGKNLNESKYVFEDTVGHYDKIDNWKIFRYTPAGRGELEISDEQWKAEKASMVVNYYLQCKRRGIFPEQKLLFIDNVYSKSGAIKSTFISDNKKLKSLLA